MSESKEERVKYWKTGGSAGMLQRRIVNTRKTTNERFASALERAVEKIGDVEAKVIKASWDCLDHGYGQEEHGEGDGIIINLINLNLSHIELRAFLRI